MPTPTLVWFRHDLRLADNPALSHACATGGPVIPVFIWSPEEEGNWPPGAATRWWLHQSLFALTSDLEDRRSRLIVRRGPALETLRELARETGAKSVVWNRRYEPASIARDTTIKSALKSDGLAAESFSASLLFEPTDIRNKAGTPFKVFTPFWKHCLSLGTPAPPQPAPARIAAPGLWPSSLELAELSLLPTVPWDTGLRGRWTPGERGAVAVLEDFLLERMTEYSDERDRPDRPGTSGLSPHLHFGEISPRQIWAQCNAQGAAAGPYLRQLVWREFAHHLLYHFPDTPTAPLRPEFEHFPWVDDPAGLRAWQRGLTGYPIVDAGMRQLWHTGWMHNRVRMIVGSFLVKDLLVSWRRGAEWFWDTLVDANLANNTLGWQWIGGCGADAAPYFRIFNPVLQGEKFDPKGEYVRRWCPELSRLPTSLIHQPWTASPSELRAARVRLGESYPAPIVDHKEARDRALVALATMSQRKGIPE
jgi:deoxyribodipyrimidine photo-lyase